MTIASSHILTFGDSPGAAPVGKVRLFCGADKVMRLVDEAGNEAVIGAGAAGVTEVTYADLVALIEAEGLVPGGRYLITDFRTRHTIFETTEVNEGPIEPLLVTAISTSALSPYAESPLYPQDLIHYTVKCNLYMTADGSFDADPATDRGAIIYRRDTVKAVEAWEDFRHVVFRRWEAEVGSGVYCMWQPPGGFMNTPEGAAWADFHMFNDWDNSGECSINHHRETWEGDGMMQMSNIVFMKSAYKVTMPDGCFDSTFMENVTQVEFGRCSMVRCMGELTNVAFADGARIACLGSLSVVTVGKPMLTINGSLENTVILASFTGDALNGDYSNAVFGNYGLTYKLFIGEGEPGSSADTPYIIGSKGEDVLEVVGGPYGPDAFLLLTEATPVKEIRITPYDCGEVYVGFDSTIVWNGASYTLAAFGDRDGLAMEGSGGRNLVIAGVWSSLTNLFTWSTLDARFSANIVWEGGKDNDAGFEVRYTLSQAQYEALLLLLGQ